MSDVRRGRLAACAAVAVATLCLGGGVPSARAAECLVGLELRNHWAAIPLPPHAAAATFAESKASPCVVFALAGKRELWRTGDGGATWVHRYTANRDLERVMSDPLDEDDVVLFADAGLLVSHNSGVAFQDAGGLGSVHVLSLAVDPQNLDNVYVTVRQPAGALPSQASAVPALPAPGATMYASADGGFTFSPLPASAAFAATVAGVDPRDSDVVWATDPATRGLWRSGDHGQSFTQQALPQVNSSRDNPGVDAPLDLDLARLAGGGSVLLSAIDDGILRTVDGGNSFSRIAGGERVTSLAIEYDHPTVLMTVDGGHVNRQIAEQTQIPQEDGLPGGCRPDPIAGDGQVPSVFYVRCASDGRTYRYRSDGSDLSAVDRPDGGGGGLGGVGLKTKQMRVLGKVGLPNDVDGGSAAVAFDGHILYYTDHRKGIVHRKQVKQNRNLPDLKVSMKQSVRELMYDSSRHVLYLLVCQTTSSHDCAYGEAGGAATVSELDLRTLAIRRLFTDPVDSGGYDSLTFDASTDHFVINDGGSELYEVNRSGEIVSSCAAPPTLLAAGNIWTAGVAAIVSSGDGGVYAEMEDDTTVLRVNRQCDVVAAFTHDSFSEASDENDQMACDTITFGEPAIWLRDAWGRSATAYAVADGYCALATKIRVTTNPTLPITGSAPLCARLWLSGEGAAIQNEPVHFYAAGHEVGQGLTGRDGVACALYRPSVFLPPGAPLPGSDTPGKTVKDHQTVLANYFGTIAYRPASDAGWADVLSNVPPAPAPVEPAPVLVAPPPAAAAAPPPQPPSVPQPQPLPQGHPGIQPGAVGQPGAAAAPEKETQAADQAADVHEFSSTEPSGRGNPLLVPEIVAFALAAVELQRRRRHSHVRAQRN